MIYAHSLEVHVILLNFEIPVLTEVIKSKRSTMLHRKEGRHTVLILKLIQRSF